MSLLQLFSFILIGLLSGAHCAGRCSGMTGAINASLRPHANRRPLWLAMTAGRLLSYMLAGSMAGLLGHLLLHPALAPQAMRLLLILLSGLMLVLMGISIAGRPAVIAWTERLGRPLWQVLQPAWRRSLPPVTRWRALHAGMLWGWLPCGLVYSVLISAIASAHPQTGALTMLAFGLGTVPNLLTIAWISGKWRHHFQNPRIRLGSGLLIILAGLQQSIRQLPG